MPCHIVLRRWEFMLHGPRCPRTRLAELAFSHPGNVDERMLWSAQASIYSYLWVNFKTQGYEQIFDDITKVQNFKLPVYLG